MEHSIGAEGVTAFSSLYVARGSHAIVAEKWQSLIKQSCSTVSEAQNTREFFLGPFSSHDELSNDIHANFVESNKHHDISLAESSDFLSNSNDHDRSINLGDTERVRFEYTNDFRTKSDQQRREGVFCSDSNLISLGAHGVRDHE